MRLLFTRLAPVLAILSFVAGFILYLIAAHLYSSTGTEYHHLASYWCELFNPHAGIAYAKASTLALVASLFFFWITVPALFASIGKLALFVRLAGVVASIAASLIFTELHDKVITLAMPLGLAAIAGTCIGLARKREIFILSLAIAAVSVSGWSYALWEFSLWKPGQPYVQKAAMILIFLWVVAASAKVLLLRGVKKSQAGFEVATS